jgi:hypothetical protein
MRLNFQFFTFINLFKLDMLIIVININNYPSTIVHYHYKGYQYDFTVFHFLIKAQNLNYQPIHLLNAMLIVK